MSRPSRTHYELLGVASNATRDELHAAWRRLVARYHPDRHDGHPLEELAHERVAELNAAWEELSDPTRRARYDAALAGRLPPEVAPPTRSPLKRLARIALGTLALLVLLRLAPVLVGTMLKLGGLAVAGVLLAAMFAVWWRGRR